MDIKNLTEITKDYDMFPVLLKMITDRVENDLRVHGKFNIKLIADFITEQEYTEIEEWIDNYDKPEPPHTVLIKQLNTINSYFQGA